MSPYLIAILVAWIVAQGVKYILSLARTGKLADWRHMYASGDMPSAHSAVVVAVATVVGLREGVESSVFGLAVMMAVIVMYDAMMVRRSSGRQGELLTSLITEVKSVLKAPKVARGHEPLEVFVGALIGGGVGCIVFLATF